ncbi:hypothetical protein BH10PSE18_BH10PSE18_13220 [soil metagenome]
MTITSSARALRVSGAAVPQWQGQPALTPVRLEGTEAVNSLFEYRLLLKTPDHRAFSPSVGLDLKLNEAVGRELTVHIELEGHRAFVAGLVGAGASAIGVGTREISGIVTKARYLRASDRHVYYEYTLSPWLHLASITSDCRIFQNMTVVEILDELLADYAFPLEKRLGTRYPERDTQTQLNETDADFMLRLCQEWGINFHFEHSEGRHRLVLGDNNGAFQAHPSEAYRCVRFHDGKNQIDEEFIEEFIVTDSLTSGAYRSREYDYTRPRASLEANDKEPRDTGHATQERYLWRADHGSDYSQPNAGTLADANQSEPQGALLARLRMDALRQTGLRVQGRGQLRGMLAGHVFALTHHPRQEANGDYLLISTTLCVEDVAEASQGGSGVPHAQQWRVQLGFDAQPMRQALRPDFTLAKPRQHSPETAVVVGIDNAQGMPNDIHTDHLGRIKIQFPWDRYGEKDERSSCWVRVSSAWAGNQLGVMHVPRVGQEVIVSFIGGDPDLPIVTGRVFNQLNMPPWRIPDQQALSGFRSRELTDGGGNSAAGRSNHLILDDTAGGLQAQLKSDHAHSQLSLGDIARIDDHAGRKDRRGDGFELRTDAYGGLRALAGMLVTTEGRERAWGHVKQMTETLRRLIAAHTQHRTTASLAAQHHAQESDADQAEVAGRLQAQNDSIQGTGATDAQAGRFPELSAPHLVLASAADIVGTATGSIHLAAEADIATTSAGHTSVSSGKSFFLSALGSVRLFAHKMGIRIFAASGPVQLQAQDDMIELIAKRALEIISSTDWIRLKAKVGISLEIDRSKFVMDAAGFAFQTPGAHHVWAGDHQTFGPKTLRTELPEMPTSVCIPCMLKAARGGSPIALM